MGQYTFIQIYSLTVIELVHFDRSITVSASSKSNCDPIHHHLITEKLIWVQNEHVLIRSMIMLSSAELSSVPFVEINTENMMDISHHSSPILCE